MKVSLQAVGILALATALGFAPAAAANQWNERTILKFSEPMMVPGATLQPGSYVFRLMDSSANRHLVEIRKEDGGDVLTVTQTIPIKREDPKGDIVLKVNPTEPGSPPAIQAWFYPGTVYGHQFIYPEREARDIAQRTKTVVLSGDIEGSDLSRGTLYTYDAAGSRGTWSEDTAATREWNEWRDASSREQNTMVAAPGKSAAPMMQADRQAMKVSIEELEENGKKYVGKSISVDGEVEKVLGPRFFTIDEPNWADLDGEVLVFVPTTMAALVREDDRVTISGTVKNFVRADFEREWGWFNPTPEVEAKLSLKPVLVANRLVGGDSNVAMVIDASPEAAVGTSGSKTSAKGTMATLSNLADLAKAEHGLVGRRVHLDNVAVTGEAKDGRGFWLRSADGTHVFVLPAHAQSGVKGGGSVSIEGVVLQMPGHMRDRLAPGGSWNDAIYIYATKIG